MTDTPLDDLRLWQLEELLDLRARARTAGLNALLSSRDPALQELYLSTGFVRKRKTTHHLTINPDVTEEQWDGLEVLVALKRQAIREYLRDAPTYTVMLHTADPNEEDDTETEFTGYATIDPKNWTVS